jgi:glycosyltransferase involved in cell wall biosynthesis
MTPVAATVGVFILAKNESANVGRSLAALASSGWALHVLDSGSTDGTQELPGAIAGTTVLEYRYVDHCKAYNDVTSTLGRAFDEVLVLDADMVVSPRLQREVTDAVAGRAGDWEALRAPIEMWVDGHPISHGSLCPPKPFALRTGRALFVSTGHAEKLAEGVGVHDLSNPLAHDDRKDYAAFLQSQKRYADKLVARYEEGAVSGRDRLRVRTPLLIAIVPLVSYVLKGGFLAGRAGTLYALDRLIAEAIMYRRSVATRLEARRNKA